MLRYMALFGFSSILVVGPFEPEWAVSCDGVVHRSASNALLTMAHNCMRYLDKHMWSGPFDLKKKGPFDHASESRAHRKISRNQQIFCILCEIE